MHNTVSSAQGPDYRDRFHDQAVREGLDVRDLFISKVVGGKSFIDVGGLSNVIYERVSVASRYGAASISMLDVEKEDCPWWKELRERLDELHVGDCEFISFDMNQDFGRTFQVVFSSGVLYHLPSPMIYLRHLHKMTEENCIICSSTIAPVIQTEKGSLEFPDCSVLFVPSLSGSEREIINSWFESGDRGDITGGKEEFGGCRNLSNYYPNWFLPTVTAFKEMVTCAGFRILDEGAVEPKLHSYCVLCEKDSD